MLQRKHAGVSHLSIEAGFGTRVWSYSGYFVAKLFHVIIAAFLTLILFFAGLAQQRLLGTFLAISLYLVYLVVPRLFLPRFEKVFYDHKIQFVRAQIGMWAAYAFLSFLSPHENRLLLWVLFVPPLIIISRHSSNLVYSFSTIQAWLMLFFVWKGDRSLADIVANNIFVGGSELLVICFSLGLVCFIMHYLMRNIHARNSMITSFEAIEALVDRKDQDKFPAKERWHTALETYLEIVKGRCGAIWLCDHNTHRIRPLTDFRCCIGQDCPIEPEACDASPLSLADDHPIAWTTRSAKPVYCKSSLESAKYITLAREEETPTCSLPKGIFSRICVPIIDKQLGKKKAIGVLCIDFDRENDPRPNLRSEYYDFLSGLAQRIRPVLHHVKQIEKLNAIQRVGYRVYKNLGRDIIVKNALDELINTLGFQFATISLVDSEEEVIRTVDGRQVPFEWIKAATHSLDSTDIQADIVRHGRQEILSGWDARFDPEIYKNFNHESLIRVFTPIYGIDPLSSEKRIIGTIETGYDTTTREEISDEQLELLNTFAQQLFTAIENAELFEKTQRRAESLARLHQLGWKVALGRELTEVLNEVGTTIQSILRVDIVMLYRFNPKTQLLEYPRIFGQLRGKQPLRLPSPKDGIVATILNKGEAIYKVDVDSDNQHLVINRSAEGNRTFSKRQGIKSFAGVPMIASGEIAGVLCINYRTRHTFSEDERQVLEIAAQFAAVALRNAEINESYEEIITSRERSRLATHLHDSLSQYLLGIRIMTETVQVQLNGGSSVVTDNLEKIRSVSLKAMDEIRVNVFELNTNELIQADLELTLEEYVYEAKDFFNINIDLNVNLGSRALHLPLTIRRELLMVCREGITNVVRYAQANSIELDLWVQSQTIHLIIKDDGIGFDVAHQLSGPPKQRGLYMMRARIEKLNGELEITSKPQKGTVIYVKVPL